MSDPAKSARATLGRPATPRAGEHGPADALSWSAVADRLRQRGFRLTPQRRLVVNVLDGMEGHVTASALVERCQAVDRDVVPSTVYRTLDLLESLGFVTHLHAADGHEVYHPAAVEPHAHLICHRCGATFEVGAAVLAPLIRGIERSRRFAVDVGHLTMFGVCPDCHN